MDEIVLISLNQALRQHIFSVVIKTYLNAASSEDETVKLLILENIGLSFDELPVTSNEPLNIATALLRKICPSTLRYEFVSNKSYEASLPLIIEGITSNKYEVSTGYDLSDVLQLLNIIAFLPERPDLIKKRLETFYLRTYGTFKLSLTFPAYISVLVSDAYVRTISAFSKLWERNNYKFSDEDHVLAFFHVLHNIYEQLKVEQVEQIWMLNNIHELFVKSVQENARLGKKIYEKYFENKSVNEFGDSLYTDAIRRLMAIELFLNEPQKDIAFGNEIIQEIMRNEILTLDISSQLRHHYLPISTDSKARNAGLKKIADKTPLIELFKQFYETTLLGKTDVKSEDILVQITDILGPLYANNYTIEYKKDKGDKSSTKPSSNIEFNIRSESFKDFFYANYVNKKKHDTATNFNEFVDCLYRCQDIVFAEDENDFWLIVDRAIDNSIQVYFLTAHYTLLHFIKDKKAPKTLDKSFIFFPFFKGIERLIVKIIDDYFYDLTFEIYQNGDESTGIKKTINVFSRNKGNYPWASYLNLAERIALLATAVKPLLGHEGAEDLANSLNDWRVRVRNPLSHEYVVSNQKILFEHYFSNIDVVDKLLHLSQKLHDANDK